MRALASEIRGEERRGYKMPFIPSVPPSSPSDVLVVDSPVGRQKWESAATRKVGGLAMWDALSPPPSNVRVRMYQEKKKVIAARIIQRRHRSTHPIG